MMIKLRSFETLGECDRMKTLLEGCGIHCEIRNEFGANTAGAGIGHSLPFSLPEIWVADEDKDDALEILSDSATEEK
jgi:hypothetical protein